MQNASARPIGLALLHQLAFAGNFLGHINQFLALCNLALGILAQLHLQAKIAHCKPGKLLNLAVA
jgi:hypothetical protein